MSDYIEPTESDDKKKGKGMTKRTRHGLVTIPSTESPTKSTTTFKRKNSPADGDAIKDVKPSVPPSTTSSPPPVSATNGSATVAASKRKNSQQDGDAAKRSVSTPSSSPPTVSATSFATSKRKSTQQGVADGDAIKRSVPTPTSSPPNVSTTSTSNAASKRKNSLADGEINRSVPASSLPLTTASSTSNGSAAPVKTTTTSHVLTSQKFPNPQTYTNPASSKEKTKPDVVVETEVPKTKEKGKEVAPLTLPPSKLRKGKEKEKTMLAPTPTPHTFSAFAPLAPPFSSTPPANENANNRSSLPPAGFSFPPPPLHSPQSQPQQQKQPFSGSTAAYTYAHRQKGNNSPKPGGSGSGSIMMNMAALLEEDEVDGEGDGSTPRKLRRVPNGNGNGSGSGQGKGKGKEKRMSDSTSDSSYSVTTSQAHPPPKAHSETSTIRRPPKTLASEVNAMSLATPGELPSKGTQGYTSLVLPRAPLPLGPHSNSIRTTSTSGSGSRKWFGGVVGNEGKIDLTRTGVAQTTMASVEVVRGLGRQQGQNGLGGKLMGLWRKRTISGGTVGPRLNEGLGKPVGDARAANDVLPARKVPTTGGVEGTVLGFTSYRKPPGYIPSSSVLVQVWAVGVDGVDGRLVGVNFGDHVWREGGVVGYEDEETGVETEWEQEVQKAEESKGVDVSRSTPQPGSGLSGLGRSFSLKVSRKQRGNVGSGQQPEVPQGRGRTLSNRQQNPSRSFSLRRNNSSQSPQQQHTLTKSSSQKQAQRQKMLRKVAHRAEVGYIPGRSFVGRVLECGWDVGDDEVRKGEWVVGLLDIKKVSVFIGFFVWWMEGEKGRRF